MYLLSYWKSCCLTSSSVGERVGFIRTLTLRGGMGVGIGVGVAVGVVLLNGPETPALLFNLHKNQPHIHVHTLYNVHVPKFMWLNFRDLQTRCLK